jgi:hypothetical protein
MAVFFLLLVFLIGVVLAVAVVENTAAGSVTLFNRSIDQLSTGELLLVFAGLGFLVALFLFLAFGSSRTRRSRRKELRSRRRDAEGRVEELERENARLRQELTGKREELVSVERGRTDATAERDRAEATTDRMRAEAAQRDRTDPTIEPSPADRTAEPVPTAAERDRANATAVDDRPPGRDNRLRIDRRTGTVPPEPTNVRRERLDDRTGTAPVREGHTHPADEEVRR